MLVMYFNMEKVLFYLSVDQYNNTMQKLYTGKKVAILPGWQERTNITTLSMVIVILQIRNRDGTQVWVANMGEFFDQHKVFQKISFWSKKDSQIKVWAFEKSWKQSWKCCFLQKREKTVGLCHNSVILYHNNINSDVAFLVCFAWRTVICNLCVMMTEI